jgi:AraC-like DNA-binding protein
VARPRLKIDPAQVEQLAAIDCSLEEMGAVLGCSPDTLQRRFAAVIEKGRATGRSSLKRKQFKLAMDGNPTMLIWLGKIRLGQKEVQVVETRELPEVVIE